MMSSNSAGSTPDESTICDRSHHHLTPRSLSSLRKVSLACGWLSFVSYTSPLDVPGSTRSTILKIRTFTTFLSRALRSSPQTPHENGMQTLIKSNDPTPRLERQTPLVTVHSAGSRSTTQNTTGRLCSVCIVVGTSRWSATVLRSPRWLQVDL